MGQSRQEPNLNDTLQFDNGRLATSKSEAIVITEEKTLPEEQTETVNLNGGDKIDIIINDAKEQTFTSGVVTPIMEPTKMLVNKVTSPQIHGDQFEVENPYDADMVPNLFFSKRRKRAPSHVSISQMLKNMEYLSSKKSMLEHIDPV